MTNEPNEQGMTRDDAKRLETAMEILRVIMFGDDPFHRLQNAHRTKEDEPAKWTRGFERLFDTAPKPSPDMKPDAKPGPHTPVVPPKDTYGFADQKDRVEAGPTYTVHLPEKRPTDPVPPEERAQSPVSAYDRPQAVIIVGPNPLPVRLTDEAIIPGKEPKNTPPGLRAKGKEEGGGFGAIAMALGAKFAFIFGPLTSFATILSQANSGFSVFQKSVNLLGATLAPLVLPFFVLLAVGLLTLSDVIGKKLLPAMEKFFKFFLTHGVPAIETGADLAENVMGGKGGAEDVLGRTDKTKINAGNVGQYLDTLKAAQGNPIDRAIKNSGPLGRIATYLGDNSKPGQVLNILGNRFGINTDTLSGNASKSLGTSGPGVSEPEVSTKQKVRENLDIVMKSLQQSIGPRAAYSGLSEVTKSATLAGLNADPIEAKILLVLQQTLATMQEAIKGMDEKNTDKTPQFDQRGSGGKNAVIGGAIKRSWGGGT